MQKIDLHLHSKYSDHPSEWFLKKLGANESYTDIKKVFSLATENGMDFVTLTDHNCIIGALKLKEIYPEKIVVGVEATTYFPEDGCKVHLLLYGISEEQFKKIQMLRTNIYNLRDFIKSENIAHSLAHATYSVNDKLKVEHLEKLILLFDVFEVINGSRAKRNNKSWENILKNLTPEHIENLSKKYNLEPYSDTAWIKGFTGGSDDHAGLFIGKTYTETKATTPESFLQELKNKKTVAGGRHNDFQSLAFSIYKIAYDFSQQKSDSLSNSLLSNLSRMVFDKKSLTFSERFKLKKLKFFSKEKGNSNQKRLIDFVTKIQGLQNKNIEEKIDIVYNGIAEIGDDVFADFASSFTSALQKGDLLGFVQNISSTIPFAFLVAPFFTTLKHISQGYNIVLELTQNLKISPLKNKKKVLWFTDTINELNGVAVSLRKIATEANKTNKDIFVVACDTDKKHEVAKQSLPANIINLPCIFDFSLPYYEDCVIRIPSALKSLEILYNYEPDEIFISTPGPVGALGLFVAFLMKLKTIGIYHTDFTKQAELITDDDSISGTLETYVNWFYSLMNEIRVPTTEYIDILERRGIDRGKMKLFPRGIDSQLFFPRNKSEISNSYNLKPGFNLCFAGRISKDKNLDFLKDVYKIVIQKNQNVNLIVAGDGPYFNDFKNSMAEFQRVIFTGRIERELLPEIYSLSDLFVFPSITDTFGMVILEAQACGLPALVSDIGGPQEIILEGETGFSLPVNSTEEWAGKILDIINMAENDTEKYELLSKKANDNILEKYNWNYVLSSLVGE